MAVMQIGIMRVLVPHRLVAVGMGVRLSWRIVRGVRVAVMLVMGVTMLVRQRLVDVIVLVPLGKVQIETDAHQDRRRHKTAGQRLGEQRQRQQRADEGRGGKIGAGARHAEMGNASTNSTRLTP
jgi:hypothetical protein